MKKVIYVSLLALSMATLVSVSANAATTNNGVVADRRELGTADDRREPVSYTHLKETY